MSVLCIFKHDVENLNLVQRINLGNLTYSYLNQYVHPYQELNTLKRANQDKDDMSSLYLKTQCRKPEIGKETFLG